MSELVTNEMMNELSEENDRLLSDLCFERNLNLILENIRNYSLVLINNCKCNQNTDIFIKLNQFNANYAELKATKNTQIVNKNVSEINHKKQNQNQISFIRNKTISFNTINTNKSIIKSAKYLQNSAKQKKRRIDNKINETLNTNKRQKSAQSNANTESNTNFSLITELLKINNKSENRNKINDKSIETDVKPRTESTFIAINAPILTERDNTFGFGCNDCEVRFDSELDLVLHSSRDHKTRLESYVCTECNDCFDTNELYLRHLANKHKIRSFECDLCDFKTFTTQRLLKHKRIHSMDKPFNCDVFGCDQTFRTEYFLTLHKKQSHSTDRRFECSFCDYKTSKKWNLDSHQSVHSMDKPFKCDVDGCDKWFANKMRLYEHKSYNHSAKQFACDWPQCQRVFRLKKLLNRHKRTAHSVYLIEF